MVIMKRRDFLTSAVCIGAVASTNVSKGDLQLLSESGGAKSEHPFPRKKTKQSYILLETFFTPSIEKRDLLVEKFDELLIPQRNSQGFETVGVFTVDRELMKDDSSYESTKYDGAVFVLQECESLDSLVEFQENGADEALLNKEDDLDYVDEELVVVRSLAFQPTLEVRNDNAERLLQLRIYNSPNYERNMAKANMFRDGEYDLFMRCGMKPVFMGQALCGQRVPNVTYMLSFENDEERRAAWERFVTSEDWGKMSKDPQYARTATRIVNLFLRPSKKSQI